MKKRNVFLTFLDGIYLKNPVFSLFLGLTLAVLCTTSFQTALYVSAIVFADMLVVEFVVSLFHKGLGKVSAYVVSALLSAAVAVVCNMVLAAYYPLVIIEGLSPYTNAIIASFIPFVATTSAVLCKGQEAFERSVPQAIADALGSGIGFALALCLIAFFREFIGTAKIQFTISEDSMKAIKITNWDWTLPAILTPFGGFLLTGFFSGIHASICKTFEGRKEKLVGGIEK